ncbi:MAG: DsrE/DsrF/DrsH-like family protein [Myxococcales bacterium]|nr:DsrE/DsrF/DrsH-like family protein [Myxococcales bacterium]
MPDLPDISEMIDMLEASGCGLYACELAMTMMKRTRADLLPKVHDVIAATDFHDLVEGAQIGFI